MGLLERAKNILLTPKSEWEVIKDEPLSISGIFTKYAMILAAIPALAGFIGYSLVGVSIPFFGNFRWPRPDLGPFDLYPVAGRHFHPRPDRRQIGPFVRR
jgi:hypothetical protein